MPLDRLLRVHQVEVLEPAYTKGSMMSVRRTFTPARVIACRVIPLNAVEREILAKKGYQVSHKVETAEDPLLTVGTRIRFRGTDMRVVPPVDFSSQQRVWSTFAVAHSDDNETQGAMA